MAVQAEESVPAVRVARRRRRSQLGWVGGFAVTAAALAALYLVMAPLLALLATAFRGPSDLLPFEAGAHWTLANLADVYLGTNLLDTVLPNTAIFVGGSVVVTFFTASHWPGWSSAPTCRGAPRSSPPSSSRCWSRASSWPSPGRSCSRPTPAG
ncbi:MAG: hypothetical protein ACXU9B_19265 [Reyranella sp.]